MKKVFVTRAIPERGIRLLREKGYEVDISGKDGVLSKEELVASLKTKPYDAVLCLLTDQIDGEVFDVVPSAKIFANYAVGFNNIKLEDAKLRGVTVTNTPDVLTNTVAEHAFALILSITTRVVEADGFVRSGKFHGWEPEMFLGTDLKNKTLGIIGAGRIGERLAHHAVHGFDMRLLYHDVKQNDRLEGAYGGIYYENLDEMLRDADVVSIHVPLLPATHHLINKERLALMKKSAYLINTSRGPVVDEVALVEALKNKVIRGAALDVFEHEPKLSPGLAELSNVILTPHTASASEETRHAMGEIAALNIIDFFEGRTPRNAVQ